MTKPKTTTTATTSPAGTVAYVLPAELHGIAVRLQEARRLRDLAEATASGVWSDYQTALRQNVADPEVPRRRWENATRDRDARSMACDLIQAELADALQELAANRSKPGSPLRAAVEGDSAAHVAAEAERRELIAEAVALLDRALVHGEAARRLPRQDAAEAELVALARLLPEELAAPVLARAHAPRPLVQGCSLALLEALRFLKPCLT